VRVETDGIAGENEMISLRVGKIFENRSGDTIQIVAVERNLPEELDCYFGQVINRNSGLLEEKKRYRFLEDGKFADEATDVDQLDLVREFKFDRMLFQGAGIHSERLCNALRAKLEDALSCLCELQKLDHEESDGQEYENRVKEIVMALTGKEIELKLNLAV